MKRRTFFQRVIGGFAAIVGYQTSAVIIDYPNMNMISAKALGRIYRDAYGVPCDCIFCRAERQYREGAISRVNGFDWFGEKKL